MIRIALTAHRKIICALIAEDPVLSQNWHKYSMDNHFIYLPEDHFENQEIIDGLLRTNQATETPEKADMSFNPKGTIRMPLTKERLTILRHLNLDPVISLDWFKFTTDVKYLYVPANLFPSQEIIDTLIANKEAEKI